MIELKLIYVHSKKCMKLQVWEDGKYLTDHQIFFETLTGDHPHQIIPYEHGSHLTYNIMDGAIDEK